jgi:hypothetical protein
MGSGVERKEMQGEVLSWVERAKAEDREKNVEPTRRRVRISTVQVAFQDRERESLKERGKE